MLKFLPAASRRLLLICMGGVAEYEIFISRYTGRAEHSDAHGDQYEIANSSKNNKIARETFNRYIPRV